MWYLAELYERTGRKDSEERRLKVRNRQGPDKKAWINLRQTSRICGTAVIAWLEPGIIESL